MVVAFFRDVCLLSVQVLAISIQNDNEGRVHGLRTQVIPALTRRISVVKSDYDHRGYPTQVGS